MTNRAILKDVAAALGVLAVLIGIPLLLWYWRSVAVPGKYAPGTKIFHLTAIANSGIWTEQQVVGYNYWWKEAAPVRRIRLSPGDHVALLLHSPDVQHSFVMRDLHIGPVAVPAGHTAEVKFNVSAAGEMEFLCMQVCGKDHSHMKGTFLVTERGGEPAEPGNPESPVPLHVHH